MFRTPIANVLFIYTYTHHMHNSSVFFTIMETCWHLWKQCVRIARALSSGVQPGREGWCGWRVCVCVCVCVKDRGDTALHIAARQHSTDMAKLLAEHNADVDKQNVRYYCFY